MTVTLSHQFVVEGCCHQGCNVTFAMTVDYHRQRRNDHRIWYCPNGHQQHYTGKSDEQKLRDAEAREVALKDQLRAAVHDAERTRKILLRDRQRFANGVCPCCNRTFQNVLRHMRGEHPDYDVTNVRGSVAFRCSCGRSFKSLRGLGTHQGHSRYDGWDNSTAPGWRSHLTVVSR